MQSQPEVQRLLACGPGSLPPDLLVDVSGILRWSGEAHLNPLDVVTAVERGLKRCTWRRTLWVVAPTILPSPYTAAPALQHEAARLVAAYGPSSVLESAQPLLGMLAAGNISPFDIGIVTAGLDDREHELSVLDILNGAILDIASGGLRTYATEWLEHEPALQPYIAAVIGAEPGDKPLTKDAAEQRAELERALREGLAPEEAEVKPWLREKLLKNSEALAARAAELGATDPADPPAVEALVAWLQESPDYVGRVATVDVYILPLFKVAIGGIQLDTIHGRVGNRTFVSRGDAELAADLRDLVAQHPGRWFVPHGLDLLGWMVDRNLDLPERVVDPALVAFAINPDEPLCLTEHCPSIRTLPADIIAWLGDLERKVNPPLLAGMAERSLPGLDAELRAEAAKVSATALIEDDLAATLPVLARLERAGAWVTTPSGTASWTDARNQVLATLQALEAIFLPHLDFLYPYKDGFGLINRKMSALLALTKQFQPPGLKHKDRFERYVAAELAPAVALDRARSIATRRGSLSWLTTLESCGGRLRGRLVPQRSGRFGFTDADLQNLPKRSDEGKMLRSALRGPEGYELLDADFDGFEARIIAGLSGDPALLASCVTDDVHGANSLLLFGSADPEARALAKSAFLAIAYDQTLEGFQRAQADLSVDDAKDVYECVRGAFPGVVGYRDRLVANWKQQRLLATPGGWRRQPNGKRKVLNAMVQAAAATIFRRALRELDARLRPLAAHVLHQVHDEVILAVPPASLSAAEAVLRDVLNNAARRPTPLLTHDVPFVVRVKQGRSWADFQ